MLIQTCLAVFAIAGLTLANDSYQTRSSTRSGIKCTTSYGPKSVAPPLKTKTVTTTIHDSPARGTSIFTPTATVTPLVTNTETATVTVTQTITDSTITDVFSTTSTIISTTTNEVTITQTDTSTSQIEVTVTSDVVTTIPTSPGFLPVGDTTATAYPGSGQRKRYPALEKKASRAKGGSICQSSHPQCVNCVDRVEVLTTIIRVHTAATETVTAPPETTSKTNTITATSTSTIVPPDVTITSSFSITNTVTDDMTVTDTETVTVSVTDTQTITSTVSTIYAACTPDANNMLGPNTENGLIEALTGTNSFQITDPGSAYDCCVDCQQSQTCAATFYSVGSQDTDGMCIQLQSSQCVSQGAFSRGYQTSPTDDGFTYIVSNGNCGYLYYAGLFD